MLNVRVNKIKKCDGIPNGRLIIQVALTISDQSCSI